MKLSIRQRLVLFIVLPTCLIFGLVGGGILYSLHQHLADATREDAARLAQYYAGEIDGQLQSVSQIALSTAGYLESSTDLTEDQLYAILVQNVSQQELVFGSAIAYEPRAFGPDRRLFAPYVHEDGEGGLRQFDLARNYDYTDNNSQWWTLPRNTKQAAWTDPYFDEGGGEIIMSTFSAPFIREGAFQGVATIDIPLTTLIDLMGLDDQPHTEFIIIDHNGRFVAHPDESRILNDDLFQIAAKTGRSDIGIAAQKMLNGEPGVVELPGRNGDEGNIWVYHAPIKSTHWTFAAVIPESEALAFVRGRSVQALGGLLLILVLVVAAVVLVSKSFSAPIVELRQAVNTVAGGDLEVQPLPDLRQDEIGDLVRSFNQMTQDLRDHVTKLAEEQAARQAVEGELEAARKIQSSLLPQSFPPYPDRDDFDLHAILTPAKAVAGDFFDFFLLDDHTLAFVMADVSGKGVPAALFMAVARTLLRNIATTTRDPGTIFTRCSDMLSQDNPGTMFVTAFMGVYDIRTGHVAYANAGHPPPYRVSRDGKVSAFGTATGTILGLFEGAEYGTKEEQLDPDDQLVLYTDGVTEAETPEGAMLDPEGFEAMLADIGHADSATICRTVSHRVAEYEQGEQGDDITVLALGRSTV